MRHLLISISETLAFAAMAGWAVATAWLAGERGNWLQVVIWLMVFGVGLTGELWSVADLWEWRHA